MALNVRVATLGGLNTTGTKTIILPANFNPKAVVVVVNHAVTSGTSVAHAAMCIGFGTYRGGTVQQSHVALLSEDGATTADSYCHHGVNSLIWLPAIPGTGALDLEIDLVSMTQGAGSQVDFNVVNAAPAAWACTVIVFGGDDVEDAIAGRITSTAGGAGEQDIDLSALTGGAGWTGQPDLVFAMTASLDGNLDSTAAQANSRMSLGFAKKGEAGRCIQYTQFDAGADSFSSSSIHNDTLILGTDPVTGAAAVPGIDLDASLDTTIADWPANGFALTKATDAFAVHAFVLALKLSTDVVITTGQGAIPTAAPTVDQDLAAGATPKGFLSLHARLTTANTIDVSSAQAHTLAIGAGDGTNQRVHAWADDDAATTMQTDSHWRTDRALASYGQGNPGTIQSSASGSIVGTDYRLSWADTDGGAYLYEWLILAEATGQSIDVGQASATDTALAIGKQKARAAAQAVATETAMPIGVRKSRLVGMAIEADTSNAAARRKARTVGQASETDTARPLMTPKFIPVAQASEADTATPVGRRKSRAVGQAAETDTGTATGRRKARTVGQALETDTASSTTRRKARTVGQALEQTLALAIGRRKARTVAQALETATGLAVGRRKAEPVNQATETSTATGTARRKAKLVGRATETDTAGAIAAGTSDNVIVGQAVETSSAQPVGKRKAKAVATAGETDTSSTVGRARSRPVGRATETDTANPLARRKARALAQALETAISGALGRIKRRLLGQATETSTAHPIDAVGPQIAGTSTLELIAGPEATLELLAATDTLLDVDAGPDAGMQLDEEATAELTITL